MNSYEF